MWYNLLHSKCSVSLMAYSIRNVSLGRTNVPLYNLHAVRYATLGRIKAYLNIMAHSVRNVSLGRTNVPFYNLHAVRYATFSGLYYDEGRIPDGIQKLSYIYFLPGDNP